MKTVRLFFRYLRSRRMVLAAFLLFSALFAVSFWLYHLPIRAVWYPAALCLVLGLGLLLLDFRAVRVRHETLQILLRQLPVLPQELPAAPEIAEADYAALTAALCSQQSRLLTQMNGRYQDMIDYYTLWAHQIKTPIASMRLSLQAEDSARSRRLLQELSRTEQYVEMVMVYIRLDGGSDLVLRSCSVDAIVRASVRRFAGEFIQRKIQLNYQMLNYTVITDEKWLGFVVEQVLSNALKYTPQGSVSIYMEPEGVLCIRDTGIGIAPEDLPRVFEKGYTGYNGRSHRKASGLGLYLCREILTRLGHSVSAESQVDHGTTIRIDLRQHKTM